TFLRERAYDIALGAEPSATNLHGLSATPFLKYQRVAIAAASHPLAAIRGPIPFDRLLEVPWFAGPGTFEAGTEEDRWFGGLPTLPDAVELTSENDALAAVG